MVSLPRILCTTVLLTLACGAWAGEQTPAATAVKQSIPNVALTKTPLVEALVSYQTATGAKITVDWDALRVASVTPQSKVSVKAQGLTMAQVMDLTLANVQGAKSPLCWIITGKNVHVTTQAAILGAGGRFPKLLAQSPTPNTPKRRPKPRGIRLDFEDTPAQDVVAYFRGISPQMNYFVAWKALEVVGVTKDTPVTLKVTQPISLARALDLFVDTFNGGREPRQQVWWDFNKNILSITTGEVLDRKMEVQTYDVNDLLVIVPDFVGPVVSISRSTASSGGGDSGSSSSFSGSNSGGTGGFGTNTGFGQSSGMLGTPNNQAADQIRLDREQQLIEIIRNAIGDEYWQPTGRGSIRIIRGNMVISQSRLGFKLLKQSLGKSRRL